MMTILGRYLAASFILPFLASTTFFVVFLLTFQLFRLTELIISRGAELSFTLKVMGMISLTFLPLAVPLSLFFAMIFTLNKLSNDSEYIAMRSFGMGKMKILIPFLIVGLGVSASVYTLNQEIIPYSNREFRKAMNYLKSSGLFSSIKSGRFFTAIPGITLFAEKVDDETLDMEKVFIHFKSDTEEKIIFSQEGKMIMSGGYEKANESLRLDLREGNILNIKPGEDKEKILFQQYDFPVADRGLNLDLGVKASYWSAKELNTFLELSEEKRKKAGYSKEDFIRAKFEYWNRLNTPVLCLIFIVLGFSLGIKDNRGQKKNSGVMALVILAVYYGLFFTGVGQAKKETLAPYMAVFIPTILLFFSSLVFYRKA